jgi:Electron transfer DM13
MTTPQVTSGVGPQGTPGTRRHRLPPARQRARRWLWLGAGLGALVAVTLIWFEPQRLLYDQRVDEPVPTAAPQQTPQGGATPTDGAGPAELASGTFVSREHATHGTARVLRLAGNQEVVRLDGFATSNGPELVVWLSKNRADGPGGAFDDAHVDLGPLKGNIGSQNYPVPAGADTGSYASVVVWCARFHVPFGAAELTPVAGRAGRRPTHGG